jgi:WhiB family redox-sensing transcriptional regulator
VKSHKEIYQNVAVLTAREFVPAPWVERAACRGLTGMFHPTLLRGGNPITHNKNIKKAKEVCYTCASVKDCFSYALRNNEPYGVWGGAWFDCDRREKGKRESEEYRLLRLRKEHRIAVRKSREYHNVPRET